jgi:hypothetical protein
MIKEYDKAWADFHKFKEYGTRANNDDEFIQKLKQVSGRDK